MVRLCEGYSIVSQYASFLVLENDAEYQRWQIARRNATRVQRDRGAQVALRQKLDEMQRQASAQLGPRQQIDTVATSSEAQTQTAPAILPGPDTSTATKNNTFATPPQNPGSGSRGGGGAIDPVTALLGIGLAGMGIASRCRKRKRQVV